MPLAAKTQLEACLHGVIVDLLAVHDTIRVGLGAKLGDRLQRLTERTQALLDDIEQCDPDTSKREHAP
jgi:hypothetical protein